MNIITSKVFHQPGQFEKLEASQHRCFYNKRVRRPVLIILFVLFCLKINTTSVFAQSWYYPMDRYKERITVKDFGTFIDDNFYKGKEALFPYNRFYGYHAAIDLEVFNSEKNKNVPVYSIHKGRIKFIGSLSGYGGVILEGIDGENNTALYGHVKISNLSLKVGSEVVAGQIITYLGDEFSQETSRERKHLHFGIYKGTDLYFHGHEPSKEALYGKWENPSIYLKAKSAISPVKNQDISVISQKSEKAVIKTQKDILLWFQDFIKNLFDKLKFK